MNARRPPTPTNWTFILVTSGGALLLGFLFLQLFFFPWQKNKRDLDRVQDEVDSQVREFNLFMRDRNKLQTYRLLGMPRNLEWGSSSYTEYLQTLFKDSGFSTKPDIRPSGHEERPKSKFAGGAIKPGHLTVAYQVDAQGDWLSLTKMLEKFQRTPFLHRIRNLTINPKQGGKKLSISMNIEAMVVHKNEQRPDNLWGFDPKIFARDTMLALFGQPSGWAMLMRGQALLIPQTPARRYADLAWVNPFVGGKPQSPYEPPVIVKKEGKPRPPPKRLEFYLRLANPSDQRAILVAGGTDKYTVVKLAGPVDPTTQFVGGAACAALRLETFTVFDGIDSVQGTVLRVDLREVYVMVEGAVYAIGFEKTFAEYLKEPLAAEEVKKLKLVVN
jgi:hypothetical protein